VIPGDGVPPSVLDVDGGVVDVGFGARLGTADGVTGVDAETVGDNDVVADVGDSDASGPPQPPTTATAANAIRPTEERLTCPA
jgi:hypothetical protein